LQLPQSTPKTPTSTASQTTATPDPGIRTIARGQSWYLQRRAPPSAVWSPDSKRLTYLAGDADANGKTGDIVQIDPATGKASILATADQLSKTRLRRRR